MRRGRAWVAARGALVPTAVLLAGGVCLVLPGAARTPPGASRQVREAAAGSTGAFPAAPVARPSAIRPAAVAGQFYPGTAARLEAAVKALLSDALPARGARPLAIVVPHAGYVFSGQIAADGYRQAIDHRWDVIVILGTNHTVPGLRGASVYDGGGFRTPLGIATVDTRTAAALVAADPAFRFDASAHEREHSVEVQVPFIQVAFPGVPILPLVVGQDAPALYAPLGAALARVLADRRALIVASSDLSHYPDHAGSVISDRAVLAAIATLDPERLRAVVARAMHAGIHDLETCACGEAPVTVAMIAARALGARGGNVISWANSGDTPFGRRSRVVGYGAVCFSRGAAGTDTTALERAQDSPSSDQAGAPLGREEKRLLLAFARKTIERALATSTVPLARGLPPVAQRRQGAFVTLLASGGLRGCVGHTAEDLPLGQAVGAMAYAAAFQDRRFPPLEARELSNIEIEISALTPLERVSGPEAVVVGRDGVEIRKSGRTAVFLPEVPVEQGWDRRELLRQLCRKAGLPEDAWKHGAEFYTFRSVLFRESRFR